ncbi:hypothetical protein [Paenibacillus kribbensis]|nr:hypothetical protein [Paenibacillus kribbensis]
MAKVTTGAVVNEQPPTQEDIIQEWKRKISRGEYPFIYVNQHNTKSEKR